MKGRQIILDTLNGREAAALMVDGQLEDLLIDSDAPRPGTIFRAKALRPMKWQGGIFLETPDGTAFLRQVKGVAPGQMMNVQVTGYSEDGKALPVTGKLLFKSRYAIVTPDAPGRNISRSIREEDLRTALSALAEDGMAGSDMGLILRSSCADAGEAEIAEDIAAMRALAESVTADESTTPERLIEGDGPHALAWRDWVEPADVVTDQGSFETHAVMDALETLRAPDVLLEGGASMIIEPTRALTAVDVNTGADSSITAGSKANFACAKALPRALRLRGIGGQITLDLAPMPKKDRRGFEAVLRTAFKADGIDTVLAGFTPLGHFELQRKRARPALSEILK